jgi:predicted acyl esterase
MPPAATTQSYPTVPSAPSNSDPPNTAIVGASGANALASAFPVVTDMTLAEGQGLSYTTSPLRSSVVAAGPATLELRLSTTVPGTGIWVVVSDVSPDGTPHPVATGRLNTDYPRIDRRRSLWDPRTDRIVQPYGRYDQPDPAGVGVERTYHVELWPIGNRFRAGHRIRLHVLGTSAASKPGLPAVNAIRVGGPTGARLLFPVLPGGDLRRALSR